MHPFELAVTNRVQKWNDAVTTDNMNTSDRIELHEKTLSMLKFFTLYPDVNLVNKCYQAMINGFLKIDENKFVDWIVKTSSFKEHNWEKEFSGSHKVFRDICKNIFQGYGPSETLKNIIDKSYDKIKAQDSKIMILGNNLIHIYANLTYLNDRLNLWTVLKDKDPFAQHEIISFNSNSTTLSQVANTIKTKIEYIRYINLLLKRSHELTVLNLKDCDFLSREDLKEILDKCPNAKKITYRNHRILPLLKDNETVEELECHFKINPKTFPKKLIPKLTCAHLHPENNDDLLEMFTILEPAIPKLTRLEIESRGITMFPDNLPNLQYISFKCPTLRVIGDMPKLQELNLTSCYELVMVGNMPLLQKGFCHLHQRSFQNTEELNKILIQNIPRESSKVELAHFFYTIEIINRRKNY